MGLMIGGMRIILLDAGKNWEQEEERRTCLDDIIDSRDMSLSKCWEIVKDREA